MAWTPAYTTKSTKLIIYQLLAIVQRDQRAALDYVGGTGVLRDIVTYQLAPMSVPQFPGVMIAPLPRAFNRDAVGSRASTNHIYCAVAVSHQDQQVVAGLVMDYVDALELLFTTLGDNTLYDLYQSWPLTLPILGGTAQTTALDAGSVKDLFVASHNFDQIRRVATGFAQVGVLEIQIDREEI